MNDWNLSPDGVEVSALPPSVYDPGWAMSTAALKHLRSVLYTYRPQHVLELGVGASSHVIQRYVKDTTAHYIGYEAWKPYMERHVAALQEKGLPFEGTTLIETDESGLYFSKLPVAKADLVVSDGPTGSRFCGAAMLFYEQVNTPKTIWVVDDSNRPTEGRLADWLAKLQDAEPVVVQDEVYVHRTTTFLVPKCLDQQMN